MPLFRAAIFEESVFNLNLEISISSFLISSLYFCRLVSAFSLVVFSFDFAEASCSSLSFLIELT